MSRAARAPQPLTEQPRPEPEPPEVLVVARGVTQAGVPCVAALVVQGGQLREARLLEEGQDTTAADRSWREWAWRLLRMGERVPERARQVALRTAKGAALARAGKDWGAVQVAVDAEGLHVEAIGQGRTKAEAWDELDRWAGLQLLEDERRARLRQGGKR